MRKSPLMTMTKRMTMLERSNDMISGNAKRLNVQHAADRTQDESSIREEDDVTL